MNNCISRAKLTTENLTQSDSILIDSYQKKSMYVDIDPYSSVYGDARVIQLYILYMQT